MLEKDVLALDVSLLSEPVPESIGLVKADDAAIKPTRYTFPAGWASAPSGARTRLTVRMIASLISRMLPGSLAEGHDAHQHGAYARRFQRDKEQASEAVSPG